MTSHQSARAARGQKPREVKRAGGGLEQGRQPLLDSGQVAGLLGISKRKVDELSASGQIPRVELGRSVRFEPADVWAYVDRCKTRRR